MDNLAMQRHLAYTITPCTYNPEVDSDLKDWLTKKAESLGSPVWMLAFADDGVLWGKLNDQKILLTSGSLNWIKLQTLHLFGKLGEFRLWRVGQQFAGCLILDCAGLADSENEPWFDRGYVLWGTQVDIPGDDFSVISDGRQGLRHAVPLRLNKQTRLSSHPLRILIRNYLAEDQDGQVYVCCSRLLSVINQLEEGNNA